MQVILTEEEWARYRDSAVLAEQEAAKITDNYQLRLGHAILDWARNNGGYIGIGNGAMDNLRQTLRNVPLVEKKS